MNEPRQARRITRSGERSDRRFALMSTPERAARRLRTRPYKTNEVVTMVPPNLDAKSLFVLAPNGLKMEVPVDDAGAVDLWLLGQAGTWHYAWAPGQPMTAIEVVEPEPVEEVAVVTRPKVPRLSARMTSGS